MTTIESVVCIFLLYVGIGGLVALPAVRDIVEAATKYVDPEDPRFGLYVWACLGVVVACWPSWVLRRSSK